jgi:hypothetical protein
MGRWHGLSDIKIAPLLRHRCRFGSPLSLFPFQRALEIERRGIEIPQTSL